MPSSARIALEVSLSGRFAVFGFAVALLLAAPARAEPQFEIGFLKPGMPLAQLRAEAWPAETRLLCGTDADLPPLDAESRRIITPRLQESGASIIPCALYGKDAGGNWSQRPITLADHPAGFRAVAIIDESGAPVLVEARIAQNKRYFDDTVAYLTERAGPPKDANQYAAHWLNADSELTVAHGVPDLAITFLIDRKLAALASARLGKAAENHTPKDSGK